MHLLAVDCRTGVADCQTALPIQCEQEATNAVDMRHPFLTETITTADKTLLGLLSHVKRMRLLMDTLRGLSTQLQNFENTSVILDFEKTAYHDTLNSICLLVRQVSKHAGTPWVMKAYWVTQRYKAVALLQMLRDHERQLGLCLQIMSMYVGRDLSTAQT